MHIETLKMFCDLVELRSFSKTAKKHLLSQSAVSQQLAQIELAYKCQFINRKKRPIELTKEGQFLYRAAKDIIDRHEQLNSELNEIKSANSSRINIAAIFSIGMHALSKYVKEFMLKYPTVNVHIEYLTADEIYEQVLEGSVDIGLVAVPKRDKRLEVYDFENEPLVLVCCPKHPLAKKTQVDIHQVQFEKFIGFEENIPTRKWIDLLLQRYNINVHPVMEFDNIETIKRAVEINAGISILPQTTLVQEVAAKTLKSIAFSDENFIRPTGIIIRKDRILSQAGKYFLELVRKNSAEE